jgi:CubicO group peptidase (beta-lactamase class C family)
MLTSLRARRSRFVAPALLGLVIGPLSITRALAQSSAPAISEETKGNIDTIANQILAATKVPSASIAVVKDGRIAYLQAYGLARISPPMQATPQMHYSIGSISKQFTAAAVLFLAEEGKLTLDDPVSKFLPGLTRCNEVTLRMLLSHTSGYQDFWPEDYVMPSMKVPTTAEHILDVWAKSRSTSTRGHSGSTPIPTM